MRVLVEASGSLTSGYLIRSIQEAGFNVVASDITEDCFGKYLSDDFIKMPKIAEESSWEKTLDLVFNNNIQVVIPSLDETLQEWAKSKEMLLQNNIHVIISDSSTVEIFIDKWKTFLFFEKHGIPTPETSLECKYPVIKPRRGRGSAGIFIAEENEDVNMDGNISQQFIRGTEYTVDVFCDFNNKPVYIVPRKRINVKEGKSTSGIAVKHSEIEKYVRIICSSIPFIGPINIQCFEEENGDLKFIEINPRIAGGMALGFAATENWISLISSNLIHNEPIKPVEVKYGLKMMRYYHEVFTLE